MPGNRKMFMSLTCVSALLSSLLRGKRSTSTPTHSCICEYTGLLLHHSCTQGLVVTNVVLNVSCQKSTDVHNVVCLLPGWGCTPWASAQLLVASKTAPSLLDISIYSQLGFWKPGKTNLALHQLHPGHRIYTPCFWWRFDEIKSFHSGRYMERWQSELSAGNHTETNIEITDNNSTQMASKQTKAQMLCQHFLWRMSIFQCIQS